jgi:octaprenyl-diphosphate synthase
VNFDDAFPEIRRPLMALEAELELVVKNDVRLIPEVGRYLLGGGGKRIRPALAFLTARAVGFRGTDVVTLGVVLELIHTATLLHDDVVDDGTVRRGRPSANRVYGNAASVLVGDYLYSLASVLLARMGDPRILLMVAEATNAMAEGEVHQLAESYSPTETEDSYLDIIRKKTAALFGAGAWAPAVAAGAPEPVQLALHSFGLALGMAFQLADDVLDYVADDQRFAAKRGADFQDGKYTLPAIVALANASTADRDRIRELLAGERRGARELNAMVKLIERHDGFAYTRARAERCVEDALTELAVLPAGKGRRALERLARFALARTF